MSGRRSTVLVVGAGLAGLRCAETLRAERYDGHVLLVGEERSAPYERPALSKDYLAGRRRADDLSLRARATLAERGITLVTGRLVARVDVAARTALLDDGAMVAWDALVLATGARPRWLGVPRPSGVHVLRTLADAADLRRTLEPGRRLAIVGGGLVGTEVASTVRALGVEVTIVSDGPPLARVVGRDVARLLAARHRAAGIELRLGARAVGFRTGARGKLEAVLLADGTEVACEAALVAAGAAPRAELLPELVASDGGIATDSCGRCAVHGVYACGDVASTWRASSGTWTRVEHWTNAAGQAAAVARAILGVEAPYEDVPYFWSDQVGLRLQLVGHPGAAARVELEGDRDSFHVRYLAADDRLVAALVANRPDRIAELRREVSESAPARAEAA